MLFDTRKRLPQLFEAILLWKVQFLRRIDQ